MFPVLFTLFGFEVSTFGVMMVAGFLAAGWMAARSFEVYELDPEAAWRLLTWAMIGGLLGSKLWYCAEAISRDPGLASQLFSLGGPLLNRGGITWYGGLAGGAAGVIAAAWKLGLPVLSVANATAPSLAIGQALGRVGCFLVGDDWGRPTQSVFGIAFPNGVEPTDVPVHPTQLYEVVWLSLAAAWLWRRRGTSPSLIGEYLVLAALGRLWIEVFRRNPELIGPLSNAQLAALASIALGIGLWLWARSRVAAPTPASR